MSVTNNTPIVTYVADGLKTSFALTFEVEGKDNIKVSANNLLVSKNDYNYSSTNNSINFYQPVASGTEIKLERITDLERSEDYTAFSNIFRPETLNYDFNRIWRALQERGVQNSEALVALINTLSTLSERDRTILDAVQTQALEDIKQDTGVADLIRSEAEARKKSDEAYNLLAALEAGKTLPELKEYVDNILGIKNPNLLTGITSRLIVDHETGETVKENFDRILDEDSKLVKADAVKLSSGRTLADKYSEAVSIKDFGAIGDGTLHTLQEWVTAGEFKDLADIKTKFSFVTSLEQSIDWCATQYAVFNYSSVYCPKGKYVLSDAVETPHNTTPYNVGLSSSGVKIYGEGSKTSFTRNDIREATRIFNAEGTSTTHESDVANSLEACFSVYCPYTTITDMTLQDSAIGIFVGQNYKKLFTSLSNASKSNFERLTIDRCGTGVLLLACGGNHYSNYSDIHFIRCQIDVHQRSSHWWKITQKRGDSNNNRNTFTRIRSARSRIGMWNECGDTNNYIGWYGETMPSSANPFTLPHSLPLDLTTECLFVFSGSNQLNTVSYCFAEGVTTHVYNNGYQNRFTDNGLIEAQVIMVQQPREWKGRYASRDRGMYIADNAYPQMTSLPLAGALYLGAGLTDGTTIANGVRVVSKDMWHTPLANTKGSYERKYQIETGTIVKNIPTAFTIWTNTDANSSGFFEVEVIARSETTGEIASYTTKAYITAHRNASRALIQYNCTKIFSTLTNGEGTIDSVEENHVTLNVQKNASTPQALDLVINSPFDLTTATVFVTQKITK